MMRMAKDLPMVQACFDPHVLRHNARVAARALADGNFALAYLLGQALLEALLRSFLNVPVKNRIRFDDMIKNYESCLNNLHSPIPTLQNELIDGASELYTKFRKKAILKPIVKRKPPLEWPF